FSCSAEHFHVFDFLATKQEAKNQDPRQRHLIVLNGYSPNELIGLSSGAKDWGEGGIRTADRLAPMPHFECGAFNHAVTNRFERSSRRSRSPHIDGLRRHVPLNRKWLF